MRGRGSTPPSTFTRGEPTMKDALMTSCYIDVFYHQVEITTLEFKRSSTAERYRFVTTSFGLNLTSRLLQRGNDTSLGLLQVLFQNTGG